MDHNEPTTAPPPRSESRRSYVDLDAKTGHFRWKAGASAPESTALQLMGRLRAFWLEWDHGHDAAKAQDRIPPRWNLRLSLSHAKTAEGEVLGEALVTVGARVPFYSLAEQLLQVEGGTYLGLSAAKSNDSTFVEMATWDGREWSHGYTPAAGGVPFDDRYESAVARLKASRFYEEMETPRQPPEGATWRARVLASDMDAALKARLGAAKPPVEPPTSPLPVQASAPTDVVAERVGTDARHGEGARQGEASQVADEAARRRAEATAPKHADQQAFGYVPVRWPVAKMFGEPATESQTKMSRAKAREKRIDEKDVDGIRRLVLQAYRVEDDGNKASMSLFIDWLMNADDETLDRASAAAEAEPRAELELS